MQDADCVIPLTEQILPPEVACCCDANYILPTTAMLFSVSMNLSVPFANVHILTFRMNDFQIKHMKSILKRDNLRISFYKGDEMISDNFPYCEQYPKSVYLKMLIPSILQETVKKVVFLDSDLIVLTSIHLLFNMEFNNRIIIAAPELADTIQYASSKNGIIDYEKHGIPKMQKMFNSGVMVINIPLWLENNVLQKIEYYSYNNKDSINLFDQELLNVSLWNNWIELHPSWNIVTDYYSRLGWLSTELNEKEFHDIRKNANIIHYTKVPKPWVASCKHPDKRLWENYFSLLPKSMIKSVGYQYKNPTPAFPGESSVID